MEGGGEDGGSSPLTHSGVASRPSLKERKNPPLTTGNSGIRPAKLPSPLNPRLSLISPDRTKQPSSFKASYDNQQT